MGYRAIRNLGERVKLLLLPGCGRIMRDIAPSLASYRETLRIPFEVSDGYFHTGAVGDMRALLRVEAATTELRA
jgi:hypothetical protein